MDNIIKEYKNNNLKIKELTKKINALEANSFEVKAITGMIFAILPWLLLIFLDPTLVNFIPLNLIQPLTIIIPTLIGIIGEELFQKKRKTKEKLTSFSKSKTEKEKDIEAITYKIEREKLINYNKVLNRSNANLYMLDKLPNNCKNNEENIEKLNNLLEENKNKIDILSYKNVLKNNFYRVRDKFQNIVDQVGFTFLGGFGFMVLYFLPILSINNFNNLAIELNAFESLSPFLIGSLVVGSYLYKKRLDAKKIFRYFNSKLGNDALNDKINDNDKENFDLELEKFIGVSSLIEMELEIIKKDTKEDTDIIKTPSYQEEATRILREEKAKVKKLGSRHDIH